MQHNTFSGLFIGQHVITLDTVPSTNDYLKERLAKSAPFPEGTVIMAVEQFAGKGQRGAVWESRPGENLTFSLFLTPSFLEPRDQFALTIMVSLGIVDFLEFMAGTHRVSIKWPNDIYMNGRKLGGILIENQMQGKRWKHAIVGIGLNVNQQEFPTPIVDRAISLSLLTGQCYEPAFLLPALCASIEKRYVALKKGGRDAQMQAYLQRLYRFGEDAPYLVDGSRMFGKICGVSPEGRLLVDFGSRIADFGIREITFLP